MTLAGVLRSIDAANRRAARNQQRYERHLERQRKLQARLDELDSARLQTEQFEETISALESVHREEPTFIDWQRISEEPEAAAPANAKRGESQARLALQQFRPSLLQRLFRRVERKKAELAKAVEAAIADDQKVFDEAQTQYAIEKKKREDRVALAKAILAGSIEAYREATEFTNPLSEVIAAGAEADVKFIDRHTVEISLRVESSSVVPAEVKSLTKSGKLSVKGMPKGRFNELYQDYVCGSALRAAREFFSLLPLRLVIVHASTKALNSGLGIHEEITVLSVAMPRQTLDRMNFDVADASDAMQNFIHRMGFKRSVGFSGIRPLEPHEYPTGEAAAVD